MGTGLAAALALAVLGGAQAQATTTLDETIRVVGKGQFKTLKSGPGEPFIVREAGLGHARRNRAKKRRSITYFSQLTDPQIADEMSPLRVELIDPAGGEVSAAWRPQEAMGTQVLDQIIRSVNANRRSPVKQGKGRGRAKLNFALLTGDQPDNQEYNEVEWHLGVMEGSEITPFSGTPVTTSSCGGLTQQQVDAFNADVANRRYTGVQDYGDYPGLPADRYQGFWDPDVPAGAGPYASFPQYPGLMDRAQQPFKAKGLKVPWYITKGNHDGLIQGNIPATSPLFLSIPTGCTKFYPDAAFDPQSLVGKEITSLFSDPAFLAEVTAGARTVPPDPDRKLVSPVEYKALHAGDDHSHGFDYVNPEQDEASDGYASYYAFTRHGVRFIGLDTIALGGGANGNLDDPQYQWLQQELDRNSSVSYNAKGKLVHDDDPDRLIVVYGHHTIATMNNPTPDEEAGVCSVPPEPGCDGDPRDSQPIHLGRTGPESVRSLLLNYPNVVAAVTGHTHHNDIVAHKRKGAKRGFWEINTASHVDFPQQSRLIELMNNGDGTLSIFGTIVDQAAPVKPPKPEPAADLSDKDLASLSRELAANDPQTLEVTSGGGPGKKNDRNVELIVRNPLRLAQK
ncbi:MAG: TIGR03767 family metallophosphoesterase [Solirubrobacterales bacterium]|nr:TIGR03767 family metallophosphoesterase [Thermoleophilales bacterium]MCO5326715.1 TIGR03767 family metallophosphoesterase [Solirubrobacterales bacterium]